MRLIAIAMSVPEIYAYFKSTLAEQLNISNREIEIREKRLGFTRKDAGTLLAYKSIITNNSGIVKKCYDFMTSFPEASSIVEFDTLCKILSASV